MTPDSRPNVLVLGGGLAGLSAALELCERGMRVTVIEAGPHPGGRTSSWKDDKGRVVDSGLHVVAEHYQNLRELLARVGADGRLQWWSRHQYLRRGHAPFVWEYASLPAPLHLLPAASSMPLSLSTGARLALAAVEMASYSQEDLAALDEITYAEWHNRRGLGDGIVLELAEAGSDAATFLSITEAAARPVISWLKYMSRNGKASNVATFRGDLSRCLIQPLVNAIERHGGTVRTGLAVTGFQESNGRITGVEVTPSTSKRPGYAESGQLPLDDSAAPEVLACDHVISALPVQALRAVLPVPLARAAGLEEALTVGTTPAVSVIAWLDRKVTPVPDGAPLVTGCSMRDFIDLRATTDDFADAPGSVYQFVLCQARHRLTQDDGEMIDELMRDLAEVWPGSRGARVVDFTIERIESAMFAATPGAHRLRPGTATSVPNLFLAGDWTRHELNASMEGAVLSGRRAADAVLRAEDRSGIVFPKTPEAPNLEVLQRVARQYRKLTRVAS